MEKIDAFLRELEGVPWLGSSGLPCVGAHTVKTIAQGYDSDKDVWSDHSHALERIVVPEIGDAAIDAIFDMVSAAIHMPLYYAVRAYFERRRTQDRKYDESCMDMGLSAELMASIKCDICWACIEGLLNHPGFFTGLLDWYRQGRWPCSWKGKYPKGQIVVL